jgi:Kef-type K+ transport system membrane component KefB
MTDRETAHLLFALALLLISAHTFGYLFARMRQPQVIGEILGGLVLGPTLLGRVWPEAYNWLFPPDGITHEVLLAVYQLGLLLLMFTAGTQMKGLVHRGAVRTVAAISVAGLLVPFAAGLALFAAVDLSRYEGPAHDHTALALVFSIAIAVTSIPVISRIMLDLGLLQTRFARIVLTVAVIEDIVLYVVLAVAIGLVSVPGVAPYGLAGELGLEPGSAANDVYHTFVAVGVLVISLIWGPRLYARLLDSRANLVVRRSPIGFQLVIMLMMSAVCLLLGIVPLFGAFIAGIIVATAPGERDAHAREELSHVSLGFFIPAYFAIVGLQLDLVDGFDPVFFVGFLAFACAAKAASVFAAARLAGEPQSSALNLAIALNARGGPGIVLASAAYAADIVDERFYACLVMLSVVTSLMAGTWLERTISVPAAADEPSGAVARPT